MPDFIGKAVNPINQDLLIFGVDCIVTGKKVVTLKTARSKLIVLADQKFRRGHKKFSTPNVRFKNITVKGCWSDNGILFTSSIEKRSEVLKYKCLSVSQNY